MINDRTNDLPRAEEPASPEDDGQGDVARGGFSLGQRLRSPRTLLSFAIALAIVVFAFN